MTPVHGHTDRQTHGNVKIELESVGFAINYYYYSFYSRIATVSSVGMVTRDAPTHQIFADIANLRQ